jgi:glycosyltransferase involved in cell wall biosynthesis
MNILCITESFPPYAGGAGWSVFALMKELKNRGHSVIVLKPYNNDPQEYKGIKIITCKNILGKEFIHKSLNKKAKKMIKEFSIDIVFTTHVRSTRATKKLRKPIIALIYDYWPADFRGTLYNSYEDRQIEKPSYFEFLKCIFFENNNLLIKLLSPIITCYMIWRTRQGLKMLLNSDVLAFNSEFVKDRLDKILKKYELLKKKHVIFYPLIDVSEIDEDKNLIDSVKDNFLFIGKFNKNKGAYMLFEVMKKLPEEKFTIVGMFEDKKLKERVISLKNVKVFEYIELKKVLGMIKNAKAVIVPSLWEEPIPMVAMQSIELKTPVIASKRGGLIELVNDKLNGRIIEPTVENFCKAIKEFKKNNINFEDIDDKFKIQSVVDKCEKLMEEIVR